MMRKFVASGLLAFGLLAGLANAAFANACGACVGSDWCRSEPSSKRICELRRTVVKDVKNCTPSVATVNISWPPGISVTEKHCSIGEEVSPRCEYIASCRNPEPDNIRLRKVVLARL